MKKEVRKVNGNYQFLLGIKDGETYWLEKATFDCDWYWGLGYVESYRGKGSSDKSWRGHSHFDYMFLKQDIFNGFKDFFDEMAVTDNELWELEELMKSAYTARAYSDMLHRGGSNITSGVTVDEIQNQAEYERINNIVIPSILNKVYSILSPNMAAYKETMHIIGDRR